MVTVTGTLKDVFGVAVTAGSLMVQLCGFGATLPRVSGTALVAKTGQIEVDVDGTTGAFSVALYGNDAITPANTYYTVTVRDDNGDVVQTEAYRFTGAGSVDLSAAVPIVV